jgi:hypothetical protein
MEFVAALGRSIDYSTAIQAERGMGYQTFAEIFYCIILQTGREYLLYVYTPITIARLDT